MILEIKSLVKRYNGQLAVDNVDLTVAEGEIFGLLGPNGAGKTTLINMIIGMTTVNAGEIRLFGHKFSNAAMDLKAKIGIVPQEIALYEDSGDGTGLLRCADASAGSDSGCVIRHHRPMSPSFWSPLPW